MTSTECAVKSTAQGIPAARSLPVPPCRIRGRTRQSRLAPSISETIEKSRHALVRGGIRRSGLAPSISKTVETTYIFHAVRFEGERPRREWANPEKVHLPQQPGYALTRRVCQRLICSRETCGPRTILPEQDRTIPPKRDSWKKASTDRDFAAVESSRQSSVHTCQRASLIQTFQAKLTVSGGN